MGWEQPPSPLTVSQWGDTERASMLYLYLTSVCYSSASLALLVMIYYVRKNIKVGGAGRLTDRERHRRLSVKERQRPVYLGWHQHWADSSRDHHGDGHHNHQVCQWLPDRAATRYQSGREWGQISYQSININTEIIFGFQEKIKWILWIIIIAESAIYLLLNIFLIKKWVIYWFIFQMIFSISWMKNLIIQRDTGKLTTIGKVRFFFKSSKVNVDS